MDHLPYPPNASTLPIEVPFLCDGEGEYDGLPFSTYPIRKGWATETDNLQWLQCSHVELAKRVQLWLYFGLLSKFCGRVVPRTIFRSGDIYTGRLTLTTTELPCFIDDHRRRRCEQDGEVTNQILIEAMQLSELIEAKITSKTGPLAPVSCSVRVLIETLNSAQGLQVATISSDCRYQAGRRWPFVFSAGLINGWQIPAPKAVEYKMADLGWCPAQYAHLSRRHSCNIMYYISGFSTPAGVSHAQCCSTGCVAFDIDDSSYFSRHEESCELEMCDSVDATSTAVSDIIEDDYGIPLMSCSLASNGRIQFEVVRAKPHYRYIAISHVWSGGLGNPKKNALPECAVKHILYRIKKLRRTMSKSTVVKSYLSSKEPVLFWMDTFCIPVGATFRPARKKAINQMTEIYSGAEAILVLDPQLQRLRWADMRPEEALVHVLCCPWMSRCWTLQENSLADS